MFRRNRPSRPTSCRLLSHELLEQRQLLTALPYYSSDRVQVPQDSEGSEIDLGMYGGESIESVDSPAHGTVILGENGLATYVPEKGFLGVDSFQYTFHHGFGPQTATAYLNVTETVYALPDWARANPGGQPINIDVLGNDYVYRQGQANDLTLESVTSTSHGTVSISPDETELIYTPEAGFTGVDTLSYTVVDGYGHQSVGTVTLEVSVGGSSENFVSYEQFLVETLSARVKHWQDSFGAAGFGWCYSCMEPMVFFALDASGTNVQKIGVDEGDIVKHDGDLLYLAAGQQLRIVDVSDAANPRLVNQLSFDDPIVDLYSFDGRLTVITEAGRMDVGWQDADVVYPISVDPEFTIHVLDVSQPADAQLVYSTTVDGDYQDSRLIDGQLYTVSSHGPVIAAGNLQTVTEGGRFFESISQHVERFTGATASLAMYEVTSAGSVEVELFGWQDLPRSVLETINGDTVCITTFDTTGAHGDPTDVEVTNVAAGEFQIYVSTEAIYVMSQTALQSGADVGRPRLGNGIVFDPWWFRTQFGTKIEKFAFETDAPGVEFTAAGTVSGTLSDQFSVDEHNGFFRIATTSGWSGNEVSLFVMEETGSTLEVVGSVENIAPNERIYSTRFEGDRAFVTTFRQVDPLFVVDLSDPTAPSVEGALKIPGYSNYLHVINDDYVLGIGRDANEGRFAGLQVSLFDVSDPTEPRLAAQYTFEGGRETWSPLANAWDLLDHHALTYVAEQGVLALPFHTTSQWGGGSLDGTDPAIRVFQIDVANESIDVLGQMDFQERADRSMHIDGYLYGISNSNVQVTELLEPDTVLSTLDLTAAEAIAVSELPLLTLVDTDLNDDGFTSPIDLAYIYQALREHGFGKMKVGMEPLVDVQHDGEFSPHDVLAVINALGSTAANQPVIVEQTVLPSIGSSHVAEPGQLGPDFADSDEDEETDLQLIAVDLVFSEMSAVV